MRSWQRVLAIVTHRIWFRATLVSVFAILLALLSAVIAPFVPYEISTKIGSSAVDNILQIMASSMLAVTTFSLTAMVSAYSAATSNITPRATTLLVRDSRAQNALSTFIGAFLFSIVGIIALATESYGEKGRVLLFGGTILVIALVVVTLLRWIETLARFGRMDDTIARVEEAACEAIGRLADRPQFGAQRAITIPPGARAIGSDMIGYVTHIDVLSLSELVDQAGGAIHVTVSPGAFVTPAHTLVWASGNDKAIDHAIRDAFTIDKQRDYDHDPRFGLVVLSEIASRALSPGINDPGTAINVLAAGTRVLARLVDPQKPARPVDAVYLPPIGYHEFVEDFIRPIARDGAAFIEVQTNLQKRLADLAQLVPDAHADLRQTADDALERAQEAMDSPTDRLRIEQVHARLWRDTTSSRAAGSRQGGQDAG